MKTHENESIHVPTQDLSQTYYNKLNVNQQEIVDFGANSVEHRESNLHNCVYINGAGGSDKTFIEHYVIY